MLPPIGRHLHYVARLTERAFNDALAAVGGNVPRWLILLSIERSGGSDSQRTLAEAVGIEGPTLTHHLDAMEEEGLVVREPRADDRRVRTVSLTDAGHRQYVTLREAATKFDQRLTANIPASDLTLVRDVLTRFALNAGSPVLGGWSTE